MQYFSVVERNKLLIYAITWMNLTDIILREGSQTHKIENTMLIFMQSSRRGKSTP